MVVWYLGRLVTYEGYTEELARRASRYLSSILLLDSSPRIRKWERDYVSIRDRAELAYFQTYITAKYANISHHTFLYMLVQTSGKEAYTEEITGYRLKIRNKFHQILLEQLTKKNIFFSIIMKFMVTKRHHKR